MHMRCAVIIEILILLSFISQMKSLLLFKTNLLIISNRFLQKYLAVIFLHVFVH